MFDRSPDAFDEVIEGERDQIEDVVHRGAEGKFVRMGDVNGDAANYVFERSREALQGGDDTDVFG